MRENQSQLIRICVVSDALKVDWTLFSWMQPLAEQGVSFTILAHKLPQLPWLEARQVTTISGDSIDQLVNAPQLDGSVFDIYYFTSSSAALAFVKRRTINGRLVIHATNWDLIVAPHLADGVTWQRGMTAMLARANRVEVATRALKETAVAFGVNPQKIVIIPPSVNLGYYKPQSLQPSLSPDSPLRLLSVMSLEWDDGIEYLLHTIRCGLDAGLPIQADVIGYGSERQRLYYLLDDFQLFDIVRPVNHLPRQALREKYQQAHFLLQTNLTDDVQRQTVEAMACGLPPLAFKGANWGELLDKSLHSLLVAPRQPQEMARILRHYYDDSAAYSALRQEVNRLAVERFGLDRQSAQFTALFADVMAEPFSVVEHMPQLAQDEPLKIQTNRRFWQRFKLAWRLRSRPPKAIHADGESSIKLDPHMPTVAAATVAVGEPYARWALAMIESLRKHGRFQGPVYVVTDCDYIFMDEENVHILSVPSSVTTMAAKLYKTWLTDWIPFDQTLFLDADVIVGRPLLDWYTAVTKEADPFPFYMFPDEGFFNERYHTGIMLMQRALAAPLAVRWRAAIQSGRYTRDQAAFMAAVQPEEVNLMPDSYLLFPTIESFKRGQTKTFNHITFTGRQKNFSSEIICRYLQNSFHLAQRPMDC